MDIAPPAYFGPLLGGVAGALAAWARDSYVGWSRRAKLEIIGPAEYSDSGYQVWQLLVRNRGRNSATACVAQITIVPLSGSEAFGGLVDSLNTSGSALSEVLTSWARDDRPVEISIHPSQSMRFEICRVVANRPAQAVAEITIPTETGYEFPRVMFRGRGFEFLARVGSSNAQPIARFGRADWTPKGLEFRLVTDPDRELNHFMVGRPLHLWEHLPFLRPEQPKPPPPAPA
jgi:hypothetical protein